MMGGFILIVGPAMMDLVLTHYGDGPYPYCDGVVVAERIEPEMPKSMVLVGLDESHEISREVYEAISASRSRIPDCVCIEELELAFRCYPEDREPWYFNVQDQTESLSSFGRRIRKSGREYRPAMYRRSMFSKSGYLPKRVRARRKH
ncbi:MAG: hypothetical protein KAV87_60490 [Desulfobacteraceae bacterium]|nr:hypothetical protein [Desulfobacteraceae bacterium]